MYLVIIFSLQFYFLARVFKKNKWKTILTAVGLYFACSIFFIFVLVGLFFTKTIDIGVDISQNPTPEDINNYRDAIFQYLNNSKIPIVLEILTFILVGIVYYTYLKRKWTFEVIEKEIKNNQEEFLQKEQQKNSPKLKFDFYLHYHTVNEKNIHLVQPLAREIWEESYKDILSEDQINYMIDKMYNENVINESIAKGERWEILKKDNVPSGYLNYNYKEDNTVYLSKIYLKKEDQSKGIGQMMINRVIDYAIEKGAKYIQLQVNKNNHKAIRFYENNGFKNIDSQVIEIGNGYVMDDFIYRKSF